MLQDTHLTEETTVYFNNLWPGKAYHSCFSSRSRGTSILINGRLPCTILEEKKSECGNFIFLACKIYNESYLLVNIYGPNEDNPAFYKKIKNTIEQFDVEHTIIAGDLNFVMAPDIDSLNYVAENNIRSKRTFQDIVDQHNLIDIWRQRHPSERKYTWFRRNPFKAGRLDMFFVSDEMAGSICDESILPGYRTDHNAVTIAVQCKQRRGNGLWKFNTSHLDRTDYKETIKTCITQTLQQYAIPIYASDIYKDYKYYDSIQLVISDSLFYETLIMMIRGETIKYSKHKARQQRTEQNRLETKIAKIEKTLKDSSTENDIIQFEAMKTELEELRRPMIDGLIIRSRVAWHEEGERSTKYFLSLEKRNYDKKNIQYIQNGDRIITGDEQILESFSDVYQCKYSEDKDINPSRAFIKSNVINKLDEKEKLELDKDISLEELTNALNDMKKGKTPGSNGFPIEFFRCFWLELGPFLYRAMHEAFKKNNGLPSHREGIITLIPKKGKSLHTHKGWRPITLLNTDYKIVSTVIANRLKKIMSSLINPAQTAYTTGRFIGENTRLLYDIIHWTKNKRLPGMILAADFESAFESVAWKYLRMVLHELNFGQNIKHMINYLYLDNRNHSRIILNGHLGKQLYLQRGIRQGDPASGYLFNVAVSILTTQINQSTRLVGIQIMSCGEIRISQYADDTILFLDGTERSIKGSIEEMQEFGSQSGLKINTGKTSCMPIGITHTDSISRNININVVNTLDILGIRIDRNLTNITDNNIQLKMPQIKNELAQWKRRYLTPIGKICIVKSLLVSKLVHLFISLPNPSVKCRKELEALFFAFIWNNKNDKVKRTKLVQRPWKDGLNMVELNAFIKSMKLSWFYRLFVSKADWVILAAQEIPEAWELLTYGKMKLKIIQRNTSNVFYKDLIDALIQVNENFQPSDEDILSDTIWFSNWTKYNTHIVRKWDKQGLRFISDLYDTNTGEVYSREGIQNVYGIKMTFLCYASLIRSIPQRLQEKTNANYIQNPNIPFKVLLAQDRRRFSKYAYNSFVEHLAKNNARTNDRHRAKWTSEIGAFVEGTLQKICKASMSTALMYLHFRIINRIYATNKYLFNINMRNNSICSFCESATETIVHLFWQCPITQIFIKEILSHLKDNYNTSINIDYVKWFMLSDLKNMEVAVITIGKAAIHKARISNQKPTLEGMLLSLAFEINKEHRIAISNNKLNTFEEKWGDLSRLLDPR